MEFTKVPRRPQILLDLSDLHETDRHTHTHTPTAAEKALQESVAVNSSIIQR